MKSTYWSRVNEWIKKMWQIEQNNGLKKADNLVINGNIEEVEDMPVK